MTVSLTKDDDALNALAADADVVATGEIQGLTLLLLATAQVFILFFGDICVFLATAIAC